MGTRMDTDAGGAGAQMHTDEEKNPSVFKKVRACMTLDADGLLSLFQFVMPGPSPGHPRTRRFPESPKPVGTRDTPGHDEQEKCWLNDDADSRTALSSADA